MTAFRLADMIARALVRGVTYRVAWHAPWLLAAVLLLAACAWLVRRRS